MNKEEIISKIDSLTRTVSKKGRVPSSLQREEMRKEISILKIELGKIKLGEDIEYLIEFEQKHPLYLIPERELLKNEIDSIVNNINDKKIEFVLEFKINSINSDLSTLSSYQKEIGQLKEALSNLNANEKISSLNPNCYKNKEEIQKSLAMNSRSVITKFNKLSVDLREIQLITKFFLNENKLTGFIYLSDAIFSEGSDFDKGYSIVEQGAKKMYFSINGSVFDYETDMSNVPKIEKQNVNPDLIPFEIENESYKKLMGYKNSNDEVIIPAKYLSAYPFVNGFAKVSISIKVSDSSFVKYGIINSSGRIVLPFENHFFEICDVYNDVVKYKRHIYQEGYVRASSFNFDMTYERKHLGLLSGYLIYAEIKPAIYKEIEKINEVKNTIKTLTKNGEIDNAHNQIKKHRDIIDFYLKSITELNN